jgi:hypothetical protein
MFFLFEHESLALEKPKETPNRTEVEPQFDPAGISFEWMVCRVIQRSDQRQSDIDRSFLTTSI